MQDRFDIRWIDHGRPPQVPPNPAFPNGIHEIDISEGKRPACVVKLPYPTGYKNVGAWDIKCNICRLKVMITAASRPDDPRSVKLPCKIRRH